MFTEFRKFALKGNVLDMAVGIMIGAAFTTIVNSLVEDVLTPPVGMILGRIDFADLYINLSGQDVTSVDQAKQAGIPVIAYGRFINALIKFTIVAFALFLVVRGINRLREELEELQARALRSDDSTETAGRPSLPPPAPEVKLLREICDLLAIQTRASGQIAATGETVPTAAVPARPPQPPGAFAPDAFAPDAFAKNAQGHGQNPPEQTPGPPAAHPKP